MALTVPASPAPSMAAQPQSEYFTIQDRAVSITGVFDEAVRVRDFELALQRLTDMARQSDVVFQTFLLGSTRWPELLATADDGKDDELDEFIERAGAVLLARVSAETAVQHVFEFDTHIASAEYEDAVVVLNVILRQDHSRVAEFISTAKRWNNLAVIGDVDFLHAIANLVYWRLPPAGFYLGNLFFGDVWTPPVNLA